MSYADPLGWVAAGLTLLTFHCSDMLRLRLLALSANAAFVAYGLSAGLTPVLALHVTLIPLNVWRLMQARARLHSEFIAAAAAPRRLVRPMTAPLADGDAHEHRAARTMKGACASSLHRSARSRRHAWPEAAAPAGGPGAGVGSRAVFRRPCRARRC